LKIVHGADLHLDSPLRGLERHEGLTEAQVEHLRGATRRALIRLVDLCREEAVDLLLLAGDLYDGEWRDYSTGLFFSQQMSRLREAGIPVVWIRGNHDAASRLTKELRLPENVTELSHRRPESHLLEDLRVAVHGQGFARAAVTEDLAAGYPEPVAGYLNIGLLHTALNGREGHAPYAPCTLDTLLSRGYDYWALGHIHQREILHEDPWVVFPGNLQGRHVRETGAKGAMVITVEEGRITVVDFEPLDVVRWQLLTVDLGAVATPDEAVEAVRLQLEAAAEAAARPVVARIVLAGETAVHAALETEEERWRQQIRAAALDVGGSGEVWVESVRLRTRAPLDLEELASRDDAIGQVVRSLRTLREDAGELEAFAALLADETEIQGLLSKLPAPVRQGDDALRLDDPDFLASALEDVEQILLPRLLRGSERGG
jgi:DNA repair exonuclease SbcCD nuclease subunit